MQKYLEGEAVVVVDHMLLVLAVPGEQRRQLPVVLLALPAGLLLLAAHRPWVDRNRVVACCNLQEGTAHTLLVGHNLLAAVHKVQADRSLLVARHSLLVRWFGVRRSLQEGFGARHRLLGGHILLGGLGLGGGSGRQRRLALPQDRMGMPQHQLGLGDRHMV